LDRKEAVALLKEMITLGLIQPSFVSVDRNKLGSFSLNFKANGDLPEIKAFLCDKGLLLSEDPERGTYSIYKL
jgi:hypothetical protein